MRLLGRARWWRIRDWRDDDVGNTIGKRIQRRREKRQWMATEFCSDCPDHEACGQGAPCEVVKR